MRTLLLLALAAVLAPLSAQAHDDRVPPVRDPLVQKECGSCHMAFQPVFLPARSWERIMDTLADHFGDDASLPADKAAAIRAYLTSNAGDSGWSRHGSRMMRGLDGAAPLRITETPGFLHKHRFPERVWRDPKVLTPSNCPACHLQADRGWYEDD